MKITFIHHSSFLVELNNTILLFDYFKGGQFKSWYFNGRLPELPKEKDFFLFSSHKHRDHFDMDNLKLASIYPNIHFVFAKDCKMTKKFLNNHGYEDSILDQITYVSANQEYQLKDITIKTLRSTDAGVAFHVTAEGKEIYHGGDLNWWHWLGIEDAANEQMAADYKREIDKLQDTHFDVAFVPMDSRQKKYAFLGFDYFFKHVQSELIVPMHMWQNYSYIKKYKDFIGDKNLTKHIIEITKENQKFML